MKERNSSLAFLTDSFFGRRIVRCMYGSTSIFYLAIVLSLANAAVLTVAFLYPQMKEGIRISRCYVFFTACVCSSVLLSKIQLTNVRFFWLILRADCLGKFNAGMSGAYHQYGGNVF